MLGSVIALVPFICALPAIPYILLVAILYERLLSQVNADIPRLVTVNLLAHVQNRIQLHAYLSVFVLSGLSVVLLVSVTHTVLIHEVLTFVDNVGAEGILESVGRLLLGRSLLKELVAHVRIRPTRTHHHLGLCMVRGQ